MTIGSLVFAGPRFARGSSIDGMERVWWLLSVLSFYSSMLSAAMVIGGGYYAMSCELATRHGKARQSKAGQGRAMHGKEFGLESMSIHPPHFPQKKPERYKRRRTPATKVIGAMIFGILVENNFYITNARNTGRKHVTTIFFWHEMR